LFCFSLVRSQLCGYSGYPKGHRWKLASSEIAAAFLGLRKEFYERCLEALDWNVSKEIMKAPRGREVLSGYAELSVVAFQMWTVRAASFGCGYLDTESEERFFATWGRECAERTMRPPGN